jgi:hypothetical protein
MGCVYLWMTFSEGSGEPGSHIVESQNYPFDIGDDAREGSHHLQQLRRSNHHQMDRAEAAEFDVVAACRNIERVRSGLQISEASAKIGTGVPEVFQCCAIGSPILARATTFAIEASH